MAKRQSTPDRGIKIKGGAVEIAEPLVELFRHVMLVEGYAAHWFQRLTRFAKHS